MVLAWFGSPRTQAANINDLVARKNYAKAIDLLKMAVQKRKGDRQLRLRLADVLGLAGRNKEAAEVLEGLADDYALAGASAQAIAVLKRIEKLQPGRGEVEEKLAYLISQQERPSAGPWSRRPDADVLEIGLQDLVPRAEGEAEPLAVAGIPAEGPPEGPAPVETPAAPEPALEQEAAPEEAAPEEAAPATEAAAEAAPAVVERIVERVVERVVVAPPAPAPLPAAAPPLASAHRAGAEAVPAPAPPAPAAAPASPAAPAEADAAWLTEVRDELIALIDEAFTPVEAPPLPLVQTPLFRGFAQDELLAVIRGLKLVTFEPGEVVFSEGEPGDSLFVLTSGSVRAYVKGPTGRQVPIRLLREGDFFGEISVLSGKPRTATITAAGPCELLELDRASLDSIAQARPRVWTVLKEFHDQRAGSQAESSARGGAPIP